MDSERTEADAKLAQHIEYFVELCGKLEIPCLATRRRATENYLTEDAIRAVKGHKYRALTAYESRADIDPCWGKGENWLIAREMNLRDLDGTDVGEFLAAL